MSGVPPLGPNELGAIVDEVLARIGGAETRPVGGGGSRPPEGPAPGPVGPGLFADLDAAVAAARRSFEAFQSISLETRGAILRAMRACVRREAPIVARMAVEETGLGRADDKIRKNLLVGERTPGLEVLSPWAESGDHGLTLQELAPWGVIAAITPSTNPTETIICNGIGMVAAGNAVVFCPHPLARNVSAYMIAGLNRAIAEVGGPEALLVGLLEPTIEKAQALMRHPGAPLLVVTGGPGVVREAMRSGKRVVGAGPGNPPSVVDETADLEKAGRDLVHGASLDNNIVCTDEKEVFVVSGVADRLKEAMRKAGAFEIQGRQIERVAELVLETGERTDPRAARVNKDWVGKDAARILEAIGVRGSEAPRLVIAEVERDHPFVWTELLLPVLPIVRTRDAEEAMDLAILAEKGNRHTASMHSHHVDRLSRMARRVDCTIFVKNGPNYAGLGLGGEGYTSFTIAGPTGDGMTNPRTFARRRRCTLVDAFRIV